MIAIRVQTEDFDVGTEIRALADKSVGAIVTFTGTVRGVAPLTLEHYPGMTEQEIARHVGEATKRWPLSGVTVVHRIGTLAPGANIVLVATASAHRAAAFQACEFLMDYLKTKAPFWKQEGGAWVEAKDSDETAAERWR